MSDNGAYSRARWTIVEVLVALMACATLLSLCLPGINSGPRPRSRQNMCSNNMRNVALAAMHYEAAKRHFPGYANPVPVDPAQGELRVASYVVPLLDQLDQNALEASWMDTSLPADQRFRDLYLSILICPAANRGSEKSTLCYVINSGVTYARYPLSDTAEQRAPFLYPAEIRAGGSAHSRIPLDALPAGTPGIYQPQEISLDDIAKSKGTNQTLLLSENLQAGSWWLPASGNLSADIAAARAQTTFVWFGDADARGRLAPPKNAPINAGKGQPSAGTLELARPSSNHDGLVNVAFCDGHVRVIHDTIAYHVYAQLMSTDASVPLVNVRGQRPMSVILDPNTNVPYAISEQDY